MSRSSMPRGRRMSACALLAAIASVVVLPAGAPSQSPSPAGRPGLVSDEPWIAYQASSAGRYGVHLVRIDGTGAIFALDILRGAPGPDAEQLHPDWSPDGRSLLVDLQTATGTYDIWAVDTSDWSSRRLVECVAPCLWANEAAWSPDGSRVAFQRHTAGDAGEASTVEVLDLASGSLDIVYAPDPSLGVFAPRWSPDGGSLVFEQVAWEGDGMAGVSLEVLELASPGATRTIVPMERMANNADWSPDGDLISFSAPGEGGEAGGARSDVWVVSPDGAGLRQVTDVASTGGTALQPTFTPDGSAILFRLDAPDLGVEGVMALIDPDGTDLRPATTSGYLEGSHPRLRPGA